MIPRSNQSKPEDNFFETERLIIRLISLDDAELIFDLYNTPNFIKFIGNRHITNLEAAENYIENRFFPQIDRLGYGNYTVILKDGNLKIGAVGIFEREGLDVSDIGFSVLEEFEGKGYMFEAAQKIKDEVMRRFGLKKISAITTKHNFSSQKLIEKLDLKFKNFVILPNETEELMYFETD
ncbi:GNAT family acetyltransferase [Chryseobacterium sp. Leaf404]|uniref:GNAT family N-acetyltransferase n=1 Tax=unclassified Chryseobacterium TaxID=2593645 RepID=UPI0006F7D6B2|nr:MULTISPECIES: GNAT family N-acetyltransferase [unclassified Chryseobacterium]KQT22427.1 GNAT family acetyltransferase [Chryseobacterium sp. Leaf404]